MAAVLLIAPRLVAQQPSPVTALVNVNVIPMDRDRVLRYAGGHTVATMLEWEYGRRMSSVRCLLVNEKPWLTDWQPWTLFHILPEDLERVELLFDGQMMRIYTREFMREMIGGDVELRTPVFVDRLYVDPICL